MTGLGNDLTKYEIKPEPRQFVLPFEIRSRLSDWIYQLQELPETDGNPSVLTPLLSQDPVDLYNRPPSLEVGYTVDFHENYLIRVIDCPFEIVQAYYTKTNSLYIEAAKNVYAFDDRGLLVEIPDVDNNDDEFINDMVHVDSFQELTFFQDADESPRRLVGIKLQVGTKKLSSDEFESVIEIDDCLINQPLAGISKINTHDNLESFKDDSTSIPLVIIANQDLLLYPENIYLPNILPNEGQLGWGSVIYAGNRIVAVYRN